VKPARGVTLEAFQELLRTGNLLSIDELAEVLRDVAPAEFHEAKEFARWLVERKWITRWQAQRLLTGNNSFLLGKYLLLERLGAGGMGTVFKAREQKGLGRVLALKVMSDTLLGDEQAVARFHREIRSAAALVHPHIVATFDADSVAGKHFLVMEYVDGENLQALAKRRGKLPLAEACEYIRQAALGLAHAHDHGMIHRDIKPANLLVSASPLSKGGPGGVAPPTPDSPTTPIVKILDFGLARLANETHGDTALTQTGQIMGTPDYIAPEQARDTKAADIRSDIYGLGCTLFRLLAGEVPFKGKSAMEKLMARALEEAPRIRSLCPDLSVEFDDCVARMMARDPAARFQTPAEVVAAMAHFAAGGVPAAALPFAARERLLPADDLDDANWIAEADSAGESDSGLERFLAGLATGVDEESGIPQAADDTDRGGKASAASGATLVDAPNPRQVAVSRAPHRKGTSSHRLAGKGGRPFATLAIFPALLLLAAALWLWLRSGNTWIEIEWPESERKGATLEIDGREPVLSGKLTFSGPPGRHSLHIRRKGYQPIDEEWVLARGQTMQYRPEWKLTLAATRRRESVPLKAEIEKRASPFSGSFARQSDADVVALRTKCSDFIHRWPGTPEAAQIAAGLARLPAPVDGLSRERLSPYELRLSGGGDPGAAPSALAAVVGDSRLKHATAVYSVAFSPDDAWLAAGDAGGLVKIWNPRTGEQVRSIRAHGNAVIAVAFSPNGDLLLTSSVDGTARLWDTKTFQERHVLTGHTEQIRAAAYSPLGDLVATGGFDQTIRLWNTADGTLVRRISLSGEKVASLAFSPDGQSLVVGCHEPFTAFVLNVADGTLRMTLNGHEQSVLSVAWSPDGTRLATGCTDVTTHLFDAATGKEIRTIRTRQDQGIEAVAFSTDGRTLSSASGDGTVDIRNVETGLPEEKRLCHRAHILGIAFSHDGRMLATAATDQSVKLWDAKTGAESLQVPPGARYVAVSADGRWLARALHDATIDLWDIAAGTHAEVLREYRYGAEFLTFSGDGRVLAAAGGPNEPTIRVWDTADMSKLCVIEAHAAMIAELAFSPDARTLASASHDGLVKLWNLETGALLKSFDAGSGAATGVSFSSDGRTLAACHLMHPSIASIKFWNRTNGKLVSTVETTAGYVRGAVFSPDDRTITAGYAGPGVKSWDISRGVERVTTAGTGIFAASPDGSLFAVDTTEGIEIYGAAFDSVLSRLSPGRPEVQVAQIVFHPEGRHLSVLATNGTVYIFRLPAKM
jgi:WD40 repeat protein/serine/threonine protein kinase